jgi:methyl-accepting chemotaxis protein
MNLTGVVMNTNFKHWKISTKLYTGFGILTAILAIVGFNGYQNVSRIQEKSNLIIHSSPLIGAAMEMKIAVARDMQMIMELLAAQSSQELDQAWQEHLKFVETFDQYANAVQEGGETASGTVYRSSDTKLLEIVRSADDFHNGKFQPAIQQVYSLSEQTFTLKAEQKAALKKMQNAFNQVTAIAEQVETKIREDINSQLSSSANTRSILSVENRWATVAMMIRNTLALTRITLEEYVQSTDPETVQRLHKTYEGQIQEFDQMVNALLNGGETKAGELWSVSNESLRQLITGIDKFHDSGFQKAATALFKAHQQEQDALAKRREFDQAADATGEEMLNLITGVEDIANEIITKAQTDNQQTVEGAKLFIAVSVSIGLAASLLLAIFIPPTVTRPLGGEPHEMQAITERIANGDLSVEFDESKAVTGVYGSMRIMVEKLRTLMSELVDASETMASAATESAAIAEQTNGAVSSQQSSIELIAVAMEQMSNTVKEVALHATDTATASQETESEADKSQKIVSTTIETIEQLAARIQEATDAINSLAAKSQQIGSVSEVISNIAEQTNLLALNAAIEAARAGEQGRGFAVVADEVRALAKKTQESTHSIQETIEQLRTGTEEAAASMLTSSDQAQKAVEQANLAGDALGVIIDAVDRINGMNTQIATASEEQATVTGDINSNVHNISVISQQTAAGAKETAATSAEISRLAGRFQELTAVFRV